MTHIEKTVAALKEKFGEAIEQVVAFRGETTAWVRKEQIVEVLRFLKESPDLRYAFLADLTAHGDWRASQRQLARAGSLRHVRDQVHRPPRPAAPPHARRLGGPPPAQRLPAGLRRSRVHLQLRRDRKEEAVRERVNGGQ